MTQDYPPIEQETRPALPPKTGMAIAALVCGIVGLFCLPVGVVGLILGIIALVRAHNRPERYGGNGMAIAGITTGALSMVLSLLMFPLMIAIMLPALGKARQNAMQLKSGTQLHGIGQALTKYSNDHGALPESGANIRERLTRLMYTTDELFESPHAADNPGVTSYIYCPVERFDPTSPSVWMFENPSLSPRGINVLFRDGHVEYILPERISSVLSSVKNAQTSEGESFAVPVSDPRSAE